MRHRIVVFLMLWCAVSAAPAQLSIGIGLPGVSIGINLPLAPQLVPVPGYPVYYAPRVNSNYFFYDGMYWVYQGDEWYASAWYNGPWDRVGRTAVPLYVLRVPVRYYRQPPAYFGGWQRDAPPRWGEHWGREWEQGRSGWNTWDRRATPKPAPLPTYQRNYSRDAYPPPERQRDLHERNYRYQPRDPVVREQYSRPQTQAAPAPGERARQPVQRQESREVPRPPPPQAEAPRPAPPQSREARPQERGDPRDSDRRQEPAREKERGGGDERRQDHGR